MGWTRAEYPYYRDKKCRGKRWSAFGVERKMTREGWETVWRLSATLGSFLKGLDTLSWLELMEVSASKARTETLACGQTCAVGEPELSGDVLAHVPRRRFQRLPRSAPRRAA